MWFSCFRTNKERYIFKQDNKLHELGIIDEEFTNKNNLDFSGANMWMCDTNLIIVCGKPDRMNKLNPEELVGKYIYDMVPKDIGKLCGDLHKRAQNTRESVKVNVLVNEKLIFIVVKPIIYFDQVIASVLIAIPYKVYAKEI
jgi:hypothetical protein